MSKHSWYSVRSLSLADWEVVKFEDGKIPVAYRVSVGGGRLTCDCFAGPRETCRHRVMIGLFAQRPSGSLYNYDLEEWKEPMEEEV